MVQLMGSLHFDKVEDFTEEEYGPLVKRSRLPDPSLNQWNSVGHEFPVPPSQYNPLAEPSPLGLRLRKSPSLLDLIQMRLSQGQGGSSASSDEVSKSEDKKEVKGIAVAVANDKLKASNFPASLLRIGSWEYVSRYEGDLVAKCYFAKHKLVWEVLDRGLKSKIEIQWSHIIGLKADCPDNGPGSLTIVLSRQPMFFRETNPQPRKHTLWQATSDFTDGQASIHKQHYLQCPTGVLNKHYEKLIQCDARLSALSRQPEIFMDSPFFEPRTSGLEDVEESDGDGYNQQPPSAKRSLSSISGEEVTTVPLPTPLMAKEEPSPCSVMDAHVIDWNTIMGVHSSEGKKSLETLKVPGIHPSMSMSDLVNHIESRMSSGSLPLDKASECQDMLENIAQVLLSDNQASSGLDEKSLMKKVNSLCCLLQDPAVASSSQVGGGANHASDDAGKGVSFEIANETVHERPVPLQPTHGMQRKDSLGDLLLGLPSIASLPKFLFDIAEDYES